MTASILYRLSTVRYRKSIANTVLEYCPSAYNYIHIQYDLILLIIAQTLNNISHYYNIHTSLYSVQIFSC